jgi:monovalent cation:H+ antiporter-2, CPA2 family
MAGPLVGLEAITPYKEVLIVLVTAGVIVPFLQRYKLSPVLGFLIAGVAVGPQGLGRLFADVPVLSQLIIKQTGDITHIAEFGIVFLLFVIGLELSLERLRTLRRLVFGLGTAQVLVSGVAIFAVLRLFGLGAAPAAALGAALALSSTAIVVEVLSRRRRFNSAAGRVTFAVLLLQDLAVVPILLLISVLGSRTDGSIPATIAIALGQSLLALCAIVALGRLVLRPLFRLVAAANSTELFMAATLLVVIATSLATAAAGLSMAMGAFVAGLLLAETEYRREVAVTIEPFKGLLLGVFFLSVGMNVDLKAVAEAPYVVLFGAGGLIVLKAAIVFAIAGLFKITRPAAFETALLIGPGGEFAFVVLGAAMATGVVAADIGAKALAAVSLTMAMIPLLAKLARWGAPMLKRATDIPAGAAGLPPSDGQARAIIVGFGRVGELVAGMLEAHGLSYIASDIGAANVAAARNKGRPVYYGDASRKEFLRQCGISNARAVIITVGSSRAADDVSAAARELRPDIPIFARARDARHAGDLYRLGVTVAVPETIEASLQLSEAALVGLGVPMGLAIATTHEKRDAFRKELQSRYDAIDIK